MLKEKEKEKKETFAVRLPPQTKSKIKTMVKKYGGEETIKALLSAYNRLQDVEADEAEEAEEAEDAEDL